jgi:hypothetical protein
MQTPETFQNTAWQLFIASPRANPVDTFITGGLVVSVLLIALAKWYRADVFTFLKNIFFRNNLVSQVVKDNYKLKHVGDYLLLINFWVLCVLGGLLMFRQPIYFNFSQNIPIWFTFTWPILFFVWQIIGFFSIAFITGFKAVRQENTLNLVLIPQFIGLILLPLVLMWHLNLIHAEIFTSIFLLILVSLFFYLVFRGIIFSIQQSVPLYYIILYICTLEILPLIVVIYDFES